MAEEAGTLKPVNVQPFRQARPIARTRVGEFVAIIRAVDLLRSGLLPVDNFGGQSRLKMYGGAFGKVQAAKRQERELNVTEPSI
jgi:hypothetical protein